MTNSSSRALRTILGAVVIGRNEGTRLQSCLASLNGVAPIVYVDSGSTDASIAIAAASGADVVELDLSVPFTAARARNAGFDHLMRAHGNLRYVQFVDGDCELIEGWVDEALGFMDTNPEAAAVCGRRLERFPDASIFNKMCHHEWNTPIGEAKSCGGDAIVRVAAFRDVGGFRDAQVAHEEPEMCSRLRRAGHQIWRVDKPMSLHDAAIMTLAQYYSRSRRAGFGITQYLAGANLTAGNDGFSIMVRSVGWSVLLPALIIVGTWAFGAKALWLLLLYPIQVARQAAKLTAGDYAPTEALSVALISLTGKFAETHGGIEFFVKKLLGRDLKAIHYK